MTYAYHSFSVGKYVPNIKQRWTYRTEWEAMIVDSWIYINTYVIDVAVAVVALFWNILFLKRTTNISVALMRNTNYSYVLNDGEVSSVVVYTACHDDVIKRKQFPRYWSFVLGIHRWAVNSQLKGQWRRALMFPLICVWINGWVNNVGLVIWDTIAPIIMSL